MSNFLSAVPILKLFYQLAQSNRAARSPSSEPNLLPATSSLFRIWFVDSTTALLCELPGLETDLSIPKSAGIALISALQNSAPRMPNGTPRSR